MLRLPDFAAITQALRASVVRFPLPCLFAVLVSALLVASIESGFDGDSDLLRFAFLGALGFTLSLLIDLIAEARAADERGRLIAQAAGILGLALYSQFTMPLSLENSRPPFWYGYLILIFAMHLGIALVPALARADGQGLWRFNLSCFLRFFFSAINAALLFAGLALALLSVDKLFELGFDDRLYPQLWVLCAFLAHPLLCLSGIPRPGISGPEDEFPKLLRFTLAFIGLPIVAVYLLILYAYVLKIGLQWTWPNGWVAMPIFILAVISLLSFALSLPLADRATWARRFHRWLFPALFPLSIVLFLALQVRLGEYGMTMNRYLGLALAIWLFGLSLAYLIRPKLPILWMPLSLLAVALFSISSGPLSASAWTLRSQTERLQDLGEAMGIVQQDQWVPAPGSLEASDARAFQDVLRYLLENFGADPLETELAGFYEKYPNARSNSIRRTHSLSRKITNWLGLSEGLLQPIQYYHRSRVLATGGHEWSLDFNLHGYRNNRDQRRQFEIEGHDLEFVSDVHEQTLELFVNEVRIDTVDLSQWAAAVAEAYGDGGAKEESPLSFTTDADGWSFHFVLAQIRLKPDGASIHSAHLKVFLTPPNPASTGEPQ
ncbi:MAG: DUF4153 domain-containing protein [Opitutales bacterium]